MSLYDVRSVARSNLRERVSKRCHIEISHMQVHTTQMSIIVKISIALRIRLARILVGARRLHAIADEMRMTPLFAALSSSSFDDDDDANDNVDDKDDDVMRPIESRCKATFASLRQQVKQTITSILFSVLKF